MRNVRRRTILIIPMLVAFVLGALALSQGPAAARWAGVTAVVEEDEMFDEPGNGVTACVGAAQEAALVKMNDTPTPLAENGALVPLPGASQVVNVPMGDTDQLIVTFSAEATVQGQPFDLAAPVDFLQVQILLNGVPMPPLNDLGFTTDAGQSDATQACKRVGPGNYVVSVVWQLVDQPGANALTGTFDDWLLHVEVNG